MLSVDAMRLLEQARNGALSERNRKAAVSVLQFMSCEALLAPSYIEKIIEFILNPIPMNPINSVMVSVSEDLLDGPTLSTLECAAVVSTGHVYSRETLDRWLRSQKTCPTTRALLSPIDEGRYYILLPNIDDMVKMLRQMRDRKMLSREAESLLMMACNQDFDVSVQRVAVESLQNLACEHLISPDDYSVLIGALECPKEIHFLATVAGGWQDRGALNASMWKTMKDVVLLSSGYMYSKASVDSLLSQRNEPYFCPISGQPLRRIAGGGYCIELRQMDLMINTLRDARDSERASDSLQSSASNHLQQPLVHQTVAAGNGTLELGASMDSMVMISADWSHLLPSTISAAAVQAPLGLGASMDSIMMSDDLSWLSTTPAIAAQAASAPPPTQSVESAYSASSSPEGRSTNSQRLASLMLTQDFSYVGKRK